MKLVDYSKNMTEVRVGDTSFEPVMLGAGGTSSVYGAPLATLIVRVVRNPQGASVRIRFDGLRGFRAWPRGALRCRRGGRIGAG